MVLKEFSHCNKWLNGYAPHLRAPMVYTAFGHFYIYELVQLILAEVVVPTHFFYLGDDLVAKCLLLDLANHNHHPSGLPRKEIMQEDKVGLNVPGVVKISDFRYTFEDIILPSGYYSNAVYGNTLYHKLLSSIHHGAAVM
ncbi:hypothetical protein DFH28DRAFT_890857 [Melampsora americana]|nr:hypothetical protein DFH28DRAFT_890857 [Melampsora americana]